MSDVIEDIWFNLAMGEMGEDHGWEVRGLASGGPEESFTFPNRRSRARTLQIIYSTWICSELYVIKYDCVAGLLAKSHEAYYLLASIGPKHRTAKKQRLLDLLPNDSYRKLTGKKMPES